jgi:hypothetical protein
MIRLCWQLAQQATLETRDAKHSFRQAVKSYGSMTTTRAKYFLARLERQYLTDQGKLADAMPDWSSKSVTERG